MKQIQQGATEQTLCVMEVTSEARERGATRVMLTHLEGYDESLGAVIQCTPASRPRTACICTSASASTSTNTSTNTSTSTSSVAAARQLGGLHGGRTSSRSHGVRREEMKIGQVLRQHDLPCSSAMSTHDGLPTSIPSCPTLSTCIGHKASSGHGSHLGCGQRWQHGVQLCKQTNKQRKEGMSTPKWQKEWIGHAPRTASMSWRLSRSPRKAATRARCGLPMAAAREPPHTASRTRYTPAVGRPSLGPSTPPCCRLLACRRALASSTLLSSPATGRKACTQSNNDSLPSLSSHPPRNQHSAHSSSRGQRRPWRCLPRHHSSPVRVAVSHQLAHILPRDGSSPRARSLPDGVSSDEPCSSEAVSSHKKGKGCVWAIATHLELLCHKPQRRPRCEPGLQAWIAATELPVCVHLRLLEHRATVRYW